MPAPLSGASWNLLGGMAEGALIDPRERFPALVHAPIGPAEPLPDGLDKCVERTGQPLLHLDVTHLTLNIACLRLYYAAARLASKASSYSLQMNQSKVCATAFSRLFLPDKAMWQP